MIQIKTMRILVFLFVFMFSFLFSSLLYYHTKIELFENELHNVDLNLSGLSLKYIDFNDNTKTEYFSNGLAKEIFLNIKDSNTVYLSDLYQFDLIKYLKNFDRYCQDFNVWWTCDSSSLWDTKQKFFSLSSFITDLGLFRKLWFNLSKDLCYELDNKKYYIDNSSIYSLDNTTNELLLEFTKREEDNRIVEWKQVSEQVNKIKQRLILKRYNDHNYFLRYKKCEQSGKRNSI